MDWLQILGTAVLAVLTGIIIWFIVSKIEEERKTHEKLREELRKTYADIIDPTIYLFLGPEGKALSEVSKKVKSYEYKKTMFDLTLIGSDSVVLAYNNYMRKIYDAEASKDLDPRETLLLWGKFQLEIRKSLGNKKTKLKPEDMLRALIKDW